MNRDDGIHIRCIRGIRQPAALAALCIAISALAQQPCDAPRGFEGRAYFILDNERAASESIKIEIESRNRYGIFTGTISRYSPFSGHPEVLCQEVVDAPVEGFLRRLSA